MKNLHKPFVFTLCLLCISTSAYADGVNAVSSLATSAEQTTQTLVNMVINVAELLFIAFMLANVLIGIALERQGHKEVVKDVMVGVGLLCLPSILNTFIGLLATEQFKGGLWF